jgi:Resolvase, N terminal domain
LLSIALRPRGIRWYAVCMERAVAYLRVSTQQHQRSGLGIEAQRAAIERFAAAESLTIIEEYAEVETGKGADALDRRPQLAAALAAARRAKCSIVVSKLDRLSRDVAFVSGLMAQRVPFICRRTRFAMRILSCGTCTRHWRKRTAADIGTNNSSPARQESERRKAGQPDESLYRRLNRTPCAGASSGCLPKT